MIVGIMQQNPAYRLDHIKKASFEAFLFFWARLRKQSLLNSTVYMHNKILLNDNPSVIFNSKNDTSLCTREA